MRTYSCPLAIYLGWFCWLWFASLALKDYLGFWICRWLDPQHCKNWCFWRWHHLSSRGSWCALNGMWQNIRVWVIYENLAIYVPRHICECCGTATRPFSGSVDLMVAFSNCYTDAGIGTDDRIAWCVQIGCKRIIVRLWIYRYKLTGGHVKY